MTAMTNNSGHEIETSYEYLGVAEAAAYLGLSEKTLYRLMRAGEIVSIKVGKYRYFSYTALDRYLAGRLPADKITIEQVAIRLRCSTRTAQRIAKDLTGYPWGLPGLLLRGRPGPLFAELPPGPEEMTDPDGEEYLEERVHMLWPADIKEQVRARVGARGLTEFTIEAVREKLERDPAYDRLVEGVRALIEEVRQVRAEGRDPLRSFVLAPELAEILSITPNRLADWRSDGTGPAFFKIGGRAAYERADVLEWLNAKRAQRRTK